MRLGSQRALIGIIFAILISSFSVVAANETEFDPTTSYEWLIGVCPGGDCGDVTTTALYAMTMKLAGYGNTYGAQAIKIIQLEQKESKSCFPTAGCDPRDTAMALWALSQYGEDTSGIEEYMKDALDVGLDDNWWLEVVTTAEDTSCTIGYPDDNGVQQQIDVTVDEGTFPTCNAGQPETYFDLNECIVSGLANNNPGLELIIDCSAIGDGTVISIIYNTGSAFFLTDQATTAKYKTQLQNACHTKSGTCNKESSLWANWVLQNLNSDIKTNLYLSTVFDELDPVDLTLLYLTTSDTTKKAKFLEQLIDLQKLDGSFNKDNYETAVAVLALSASGSSTELTNAIEYLKGSRKVDGSWDGNDETTAMVLFAAFNGASITLPSPAPPPGGSDLSATCGDGVCDPSETPFSCASDCADAGVNPCAENGFCEVEFGENKQNCGNDCYCGDGACDSVESAAGSCDVDCGGSPADGAYCGDNVREGSEQCDGSDAGDCGPGYFCDSQCGCSPVSAGVDDSGSSKTWLIVVAIVILLGLAAYFGFVHYFSKQKKKPKRSFGSSVHNVPSMGGFEHPKKAAPARSRRVPAQRKGPKSAAEKELEKSLKEAKKLLGK